MLHCVHLSSKSSWFQYLSIPNHKSTNSFQRGSRSDDLGSGPSRGRNQRGYEDDDDGGYDRVRSFEVKKGMELRYGASHGCCSDSEARSCMVDARIIFVRLDAKFSIFSKFQQKNLKFEVPEDPQPNRSFGFGPSQKRPDEKRDYGSKYGSQDRKQQFGGQSR